MTTTRDRIAERLQMFDSDRATAMADYLMPLVDQMRAEAVTEALEMAADVVRRAKERTMTVDEIRACAATLHAALDGGR